ncbi:MAG: hypothetical protein JNK38_20115 [Acidobacteria bacterium]|nr:hypothetical protein [Acidobacteriota bacterium]
MKFLYTLVFIAAIVVPANFQPEPRVVSKQHSVEKCQPNIEHSYNRQEILEKFASILNASAPGYKKYESRGFYIENERPQKFFIYDLTDTSNKGTPLGGCVQIQNKHVYHVAPIYTPFSFSHIITIHDKSLKVFRNINCKGRGNSLEDVISYLNQELINSKDKDKIIARVKNYRKHGIYATIDDLRLRCEEAINDSSSGSDR